MEHVGTRPAAEDPSGDEPASPTIGEASNGDGGDDGTGLPPTPESGGPKTLVAVAVLVIVAVVGLVGWLISRGEGDLDELGTPTVPSTEASAATLPTDSAVASSTVVPATIAPVTTLPVTEPAIVPSTLPATDPPQTDAPGTVLPTVPATAPLDPGVAPTTTPSSTPGDEDPGFDVGDLVPSVSAFPEPLDPAQLATVVAELLVTPRHDVASPTPVYTLCAIVQMEGRLTLSGRWEFDGRPLSSSDEASLAPPGFGDCIDNDGAPMEDGAYQFIAADSSGRESAAGTFVAGAQRVDQRFSNNSDEAVCSILIAPSTADYYDAFVFPGPPPIRPGDEITIPIAGVRQDVRTIGCADDDRLAEFSFDPDPAEPQDLVPD